MDKLVRRKITITVIEEWTVTWLPATSSSGPGAEEATRLLALTGHGDDAPSNLAPPSETDPPRSQQIEIDSTTDAPRYLVLKRLRHGSGWRYLTLDEACDELCISVEPNP